MHILTNIFIGRSGCGKGTQIDKLIELIEEKNLGDVCHLEAGDRFRNFIGRRYWASEIARGICDRGELQPEFLSVWAWADELIKTLKKDQHLFVDGTPRRLNEARILETAFDFFGRDKVNIIYLNVSRKWAADRMKDRGRSDDLELENREMRLNWFEEEVVPVLDYYRSHKTYNFIDINGEQSIREVHYDIVKAVGL